MIYTCMDTHTYKHTCVHAYNNACTHTYKHIVLTFIPTVLVNLDMTDSMGPGKLVRHMQIRRIHMPNT